MQEQVHCSDASNSWDRGRELETSYTGGGKSVIGAIPAVCQCVCVSRKLGQEMELGTPDVDAGRYTQHHLNPDPGPC